MRKYAHEVFVTKNVGNKTESFKINNSKDAYNFISKVFNQEALEVREEFLVLFLNRTNKTIAWSKISTGGLNATVVDTRLIFKQALDCLASGIILAHNHPSGNLSPSAQDKAITNKIKDGAKLFEMEVIEHLILTSEGYYSFVDEGEL